MNKAKNYCCDIYINPDNLKFHKDVRMFQGCPTIAVSRGGRIFLGWYSGGTKEPHIKNYNLVVYSDDLGKTWSDPVLIIDSNKEKMIQALDIQLFTDEKGRLHIQWVQNNVKTAPEVIPKAKKGQPLVVLDGNLFDDFQHNEWEIICDDPDAAELVFSEPRFVYHGFLRCKPVFLNNGDWLNFAYDQLNDRYGYYISSDKGESYSHFYGSKKMPTVFDETMAYQKSDGTVIMFARTHAGELARSVSYDNGRTWTETELSGIVSADTRFFVKKLPSGRVMLVVNDDAKTRKNMTVFLSEDDGENWQYKKCIDSRCDVSYPDADISGARIFLTYDRSRCGHKEILFASFTESEIIENKEIEITIVSKPKEVPLKNDVKKAVEDNKIIAILRDIPADKLIETAEALYSGGIRLLEITYSSDGSIADEAVAENIKLLSEKFGGRMYIGAGTVLNKKQVFLTKLSGGSFVISPNIDKDVIQECSDCGLVSIPGAFTPSEIVAANKWGADFVKVFPAASLGANYFNAVSAPLGGIKLLAVGGIDESNIKKYLAAGAVGVGVGSCLVNKQTAEKSDFDAVTELAKKYTAIINND